MLEFPKLTGKFNVGTHIFHWVDDKRIEDLIPDSTQQRELLVQAWYPADHDASELYQYAPDLLRAWKLGLESSGFPVAHVNQVEGIKVHAKPNAPLLSSSSPYPLILFFHGYVAFRTAYTAYCEELASHGYIVVVIGHTYYSQLSVFPNEKEISALPEHLSQKKLTNTDTSRLEQSRWLADAEFVIKKLEHESAVPDSFFFNNLDLKNMAAIGHSFGGSTAINLLIKNANIKVAIDLDGGIFGLTIDDINKLKSKPLLIIVGQLSWEAFDNCADAEIANRTGFDKSVINVLRENYRNKIQELISGKSNNLRFAMINNADHAAFSDWVLLKSLPLYAENKAIFDLEKLTGKGDPYKIFYQVMTEMLSILNNYLH